MPLDRRRDSESDIDIKCGSGDDSDESIEVHRSIEVGVLLKYEQIYMKYRFSDIIGSYSYQCCAVSAVVYINAIIQNGNQFLPLLSFIECCTIAFCGGGDIMKSIIMLERHFLYGIICEKVDIMDILFSDTLSGSLVACFSSLDYLLKGALTKDWLEDSNNHLSYLVKKYDIKNNYLICRKPWCTSETFQFALFAAEDCCIFKVHSMLMSRKTRFQETFFIWNKWINK